jgi:hypothetical protein
MYFAILDLQNQRLKDLINMVNDEIRGNKGQNMIRYASLIFISKNFLIIISCIKKA